jgi:hypothetical protein
MYKYDCSLLKLTDKYSFVPVKFIIELVQIIHRAEYQNEYFANVFMF